MSQTENFCHRVIHKEGQAISNFLNLNYSKKKKKKKVCVYGMGGQQFAEMFFLLGWPTKLYVELFKVDQQQVSSKNTLIKRVFILY